jgi:hypothetical protein
VNSGPRMSRADSEAAGYWHPIGGGKKLSTLMTDMQYKRLPDPSVQVPPRQFILPESLQGNQLLPATGDRSAAGQILWSVDGVPFKDGVPLGGGADFMRTHGSALDPDESTIWAAAKGATKQLHDKAASAADKGIDSAMMYMPMGHTSSDFATMMSDTLIEQMKYGKITKKLKREFDADVRTKRPEWKGIDHPESRSQLHSNGALRIALIDKMGLGKYQGGGFPDLPTARTAIMEPGLLDAPLHAGGYSIGRMDPTRAPTLDHPKPHASYPSQVHGSYLGGFEVPVPRDVLFSDFNAKRRALPDDKGSRFDVRSFQLSHPTQMADQQWVDNVSRYIDQAKEGRR